MMPNVGNYYGIHVLEYHNKEYRIGPTCLTIHNIGSDTAEQIVFLKNLYEHIDFENFYPLVYLYCKSGR